MPIDGQMLLGVYGFSSLLNQICITWENRLPRFCPLSFLCVCGGGGGDPDARTIQALYYWATSLAFFLFIVKVWDVVSLSRLALNFLCSPGRPWTRDPASASCTWITGLCPQNQIPIWVLTPTFLCHMVSFPVERHVDLSEPGTAPNLGLGGPEIWPANNLLQPWLCVSPKLGYF